MSCLTFIFGCAPHWTVRDSTIIFPPDKRGSVNEIFADRKVAVEQYVSTNPDLSEDIKTGLLSYQIKVNMTKEQVKLIAGKPSSIKHNENGQETWIYDRTATTGQRVTLLFDSDILVKIEERILRGFF